MQRFNPLAPDKLSNLNFDPLEIAKLRGRPADLSG